MCGSNGMVYGMFGLSGALGMQAYPGQQQAASADVQRVQDYLNATHNASAPPPDPGKQVDRPKPIKRKPDAAVIDMHQRPGEDDWSPVVSK